MGDVGVGLYVTAGIPEEMRKRVVPAADIITPNQFELELLTGATIKHLDDAVAAARGLIATGPGIVLVTSLRHEETRADEIEMLAVTAEDCWRVRTPFLDMDPMPHGSGDAVAALFLAHYLSAGLGDAAVPIALAGAAGAIFAIMSATQKVGSGELALIAAGNAIAQPPQSFEVQRIG